GFDGASVSVQTVSNGGNAFGSAALNAAGDASFSLNTLPIGSHTINVNYLGSTNYATSFVTQTLVVRGNTTMTLTAAPSPAAVGDTVTFTVTVTKVPPATATPSGTLSFYDGPIIAANLIGTANLNASGVGVFPISTLGFGSHTINVAYPGDGAFLPNSA